MNDERLIRVLRGLDAPVDHVPDRDFADRLFAALQREARHGRVSRTHLLVAAALMVTALLGATIATIGGLPRDDRAVIVPSPIGSAAPSTSPIPALADCSNVTLATVTEALRSAPSYAYEGEGYVERYEDLYERPGVEYDPLSVPERVVRMPLRFSGAYQAPDRSAFERSLVTNDDFIEARRQVGAAGWHRFVGSQRWRSSEGAPQETNELLSLVAREPTTWNEPDAESMAGQCVLAGAGTDADGEIERAVKVVVDPRSALPITLEAGVRRDVVPDWGRSVASMEIYHLVPDRAVTIEAPTVDTGPARAEEVLYALARRGCRFVPCDVDGVGVAYEAHDGPVDIFGFEGPGRHGTVWFQDGLATTMSHSGCAPTPAFAVNFHENDEEGPRWIGGPISGEGSLTMRIWYDDGVQEEHAVSAPAYIVQAGTVGGPEVREISVLGPNGDEMFSYLQSSPATGVPPPSGNC